MSQVHVGIASLLGLFFFANAANAVTIGFTENTTDPTGSFITAPLSHTGQFVQSTSGNDDGKKLSPFQGTSVPITTPYSALSVASLGEGTATYSCSGCTTFGLLWGSPDAYNFVSFYASADGTGAPIATFTGSSLLHDTPGSGFDRVTFTASGGVFNSVVLTDSGQAAFEYAFVSPVPGPVVGAGLPGTVGACFALLALVRRRRAKAG